MDWTGTGGRLGFAMRTTGDTFLTSCVQTDRRVFPPETFASLILGNGVYFNNR
jgi:hypothetical protein